MDNNAGETARAWRSVFKLSQQAVSEKIDGPRIQEGFARLLAGDLKEWPAPAHIFDKMPARPPQARLETHEPASDPVNTEGIAQLRLIITGAANEKSTTGDDKPNERQRSQANRREKK